METQKYTRQQPTSLQIARKYYSVLCALNDIPIGDKELVVVSFIGSKGRLTKEGRAQLRFEYGFSLAALSNILRRLQQKQLILKDNTPNPFASAKFDEGIKLEICISRQ